MKELLIFAALAVLFILVCSIVFGIGTGLGRHLIAWVLA